MEPRKLLDPPMHIEFSCWAKYPELLGHAAIQGTHLHCLGPEGLDQHGRACQHSWDLGRDLQAPGASHLQGHQCSLQACAGCSWWTSSPAPCPTFHSGAPSFLQFKLEFPYSTWHPCFSHHQSSMFCAAFHRFPSSLNGSLRVWNSADQCQSGFQLFWTIPIQAELFVNMAWPDLFSACLQDGKRSRRALDHEKEVAKQIRAQSKKRFRENFIDSCGVGVRLNMNQRQKKCLNILYSQLEVSWLQGFSYWHASILSYPIRAFILMFSYAS